MTTEEFQTMGIWVVRFLIYGTVGAIILGLIIVFIRSIRANLRSRGILGIVIIAFQLLSLIGIIMILVYFGNEYGWVDKIQDLIP